MSPKARPLPRIREALLVAFVATAAGCGGDDTEVPLDASSADSSIGDGSGPPPTGDASSEGGADSTVAPADGGGVADGGVDAAPPVDAAPLPVLSCTGWRFAAPIVLDTLSQEGGTFLFNGPLWVGSPAAGQVRVISQPSGTTFRLYDLDKASSMVSPIDGPTLPFPSYTGAHHFTLGASEQVTQVVVDDTTADPGTLEAYLIPDAITSSAQIPAPLALSRDGFATILPFDDTDVFVALEYEDLIDPPDFEYELAVGRATSTTQATLAEVAVSPSIDAFLSPAIAHVGSNVYLFSSSRTATPGESLWIVPDTATVPAPLTAATFDTGVYGTMEDVAPSAGGGATNIAYVAQATDDSSVTIEVGQIANGALGSVTAADLVKARTYTQLANVPAAAEGLTQWSGDDIAFIGVVPGTNDDGGANVGANFLWVNANGQVRAEAVGANALLRDRGPVIQQIVASPAGVSGVAAAWDVAWVETQSTGYVLLYNELDCQLGD